MKKVTLIFLVLCLTVFFAIGTASATSLTLDDNYIGDGDHKNPDRDRMGNIKFEIFSLAMTWDWNNDSLAIDISTNYNGTQDGNMSGTEMGDFFISTDGYSPFGDSPYYEDDMSNGEDWEYALVFDSHDIYGNNKPSSGSFSLYQLFADSTNTNSYSDKIITADEFHLNNNGVRKDQEVRVNTDVAAQIGGFIGSWTADAAGIHLGIDNFSTWGLNNIDAVRWQMTCANDVIEGTPVPEPATLLLLGFGLTALVGVSRKKIMKK